MLNVQQIQEIVPLRPPSLYIDRIIEIDPGKRTKAIKNVTINEPYFAGVPADDMHMPEVMFIEIFGQLGNTTFLSSEANKGKLGLLTAVKSFNMIRPAIPGDTLIVEFEFVTIKRNNGRGKATAKVDGEIVAEAELLYMMNDRQD